jgi:hypothetical protein
VRIRRSCSGCWLIKGRNSKLSNTTAYKIAHVSTRSEKEAISRSGEDVATTSQRQTDCGRAGKAASSVTNSVTPNNNAMKKNSIAFVKQQTQSALGIHYFN